MATSRVRLGPQTPAPYVSPLELASLRKKWIKGKPGWFEWREILKTLPAEANSEEKTDDILSREN
jgi:hypothetical protein